jgi:hypothetical protein
MITKQCWPVSDGVLTSDDALWRMKQGSNRVERVRIGLTRPDSVPVSMLGISEEPRRPASQ